MSGRRSHSVRRCGSRIFRVASDILDPPSDAIYDKYRHLLRNPTMPIPYRACCGRHKRPPSASRDRLATTAAQPPAAFDLRHLKHTAAHARTVTCGQYALVTLRSGRNAAPPATAGGLTLLDLIFYLRHAEPKRRGSPETGKPRLGMTGLNHLQAGSHPNQDLRARPARSSLRGPQILVVYRMAAACLSKLHNAQCSSPGHRAQTH